MENILAIIVDFFTRWLGGQRKRELSALLPPEAVRCEHCGLDCVPESVEPCTTCGLAGCQNCLICYADGATGLRLQWHTGCPVPNQLGRSRGTHGRVWVREVRPLVAEEVGHG